jgi:hypothetical protein
VSGGWEPGRAIREDGDVRHPWVRLLLILVGAIALTSAILFPVLIFAGGLP